MYNMSDDTPKATDAEIDEELNREDDDDDDLDDDDEDEDDVD